MNSQAERKAFMQVNCPQEATRDMTEESVTRKFSAPIQTYFCFAIISLTICLLASLGTIVVLVLQRTGSTTEYDGHQGREKCVPWKISAEALKGLQTMASEKAAAYLQVLRPINQSELRWINEGILYNIHYNHGRLVIQTPGMYFIYCHLHFYIAECKGGEITIKLEILVNTSVARSTLLTLCSSQKTFRDKRQDLFVTLLAELKKGNTIGVQVNEFSYVDVSDFPENNVFGAFKYTGENWRYSLFRTEDEK
ncbi:tumor necrosis factor ligand superfamily member 8 [Podarcis lilfordi]|uniref:Tumor necrosis factor ligand superfamily member 8 n=1 Tax=Podarcis lilfordi TaxID=74358 RepID=A0AA35PRJ6_9SAUR|nr:tumor necrosis factor ligand superfamily member 8 [Podarcis lilfordi]